MIDVRQVLPAKIKLVEDDEKPYLEWEPSTGAMARKGRILKEFCALADAKPEQFLRFAKQYGVLGLCPHQRLVGSCQEEGCAGWRANSWRDVREGRRPSGPNYCRKESIKTWRFFALWVRALKNAGQSLHNPAVYRLSKEDRVWLSIIYSDDGIEAGPRGVTVKLRRITRGVVTRCVQLLLVDARVIPFFSWAAHGKPYLGLASTVDHNLLAPVTIALAHELLAEDYLDAPPCTCNSCYEQYMPKKRLDPNLTTWCPKEKCQRAKSVYYARLSRTRKWDREHLSEAIYESVFSEM